MEEKYSNKYLIETGMGLQDVDRLSNSTYFVNESNRYINGEITLDKLDEIINDYYTNKENTFDRSEEADKVAIRICRILSDDSFSFTSGQYLSIHKYLFDGIINNAGKFRTYNFSKKEWVLNNASVSYGDYRQLKQTLEYDFNAEKDFNYRNLTMDEVINHLATFIANLWQIHIFEEGNTRLTAVFVIKYLRSLGFDVNNDMFAKNAWYFRNSLVRANYTNIPKGIYEDKSYLILFLKNLLLNENNVLENKRLHINSENTESKNVETIILDMMKDNPKIKLDDIANNLNISLRTTKTIVMTLKNKGLIKRVNGKRNGYWGVKENRE